MRSMIRASFKAQVAVEDPAEIARLKMLAIVGLQNYVIHEQTGCAAADDLRPGAHACSERSLWPGRLAGRRWQGEVATGCHRRSEASLKERRRRGGIDTLGSREVERGRAAWLVGSLWTQRGAICASGGPTYPRRPRVTTRRVCVPVALSGLGARDSSCARHAPRRTRPRVRRAPRPPPSAYSTRTDCVPRYIYVCRYPRRIEVVNGSACPRTG